MIALTLIGLIAGTTIAIHFRVFALIPATISILAVVVIVGMLRGESGLWIVGTMILAATSLQLGFLGGGTIWFALREKPESPNKSEGITHLRFPGDSA